MVCHGLHMKSSNDDLDPGMDLASQLQKALQEAVLTTVGRDPKHGPLVVASLGSMMATFAVQLELVDRGEAGASDEPTTVELDVWEDTFVDRCREFHRLICQALQMRKQPPPSPVQANDGGKPSISN